MTRDEAIFDLQHVKQFLVESDSLTDAEKEALDMAIEALERPHGEWVIDGEYIDCSVCRQDKWSRVPFEDLVKRFKYCPSCGADMRGGR